MDPAGVCAGLCRAPPKRGERYRRGSCPKEAAFESVFCSAIVRHTQEYREGSRLPRSFACILVRLLLSFFLWEPIVVQAYKRAYVRVNARLVGYAIRESKHVSDFSLSPPSLFLTHSLARSVSLSAVLRVLSLSFSLIRPYLSPSLSIYLPFSLLLSYSLSFPLSLSLGATLDALDISAEVACVKVFSRTWTSATTRSRDVANSRSDSVLRVPSSGDTNLARHYAIDVHRPNKKEAASFTAEGEDGGGAARHAFIFVFRSRGTTRKRCRCRRRRSFGFLHFASQ